MLQLIEVLSLPDMDQTHFEEFRSNGFTVYQCDYGIPDRDPHFEIHKNGKNALHNPSVVSLDGVFCLVYCVIGPRVGCPATVLMYSDRHAATVTEILHTKDGRIKGVRVRQDTAIRTDNNGMSESQDYRYEPNPAGGEFDARLVIPKRQTENRLGKYGIYVNGPVKDWSYRIAVGYRQEYHDYSF